MGGVEIGLSPYGNIDPGRELTAGCAGALDEQHGGGGGNLDDAGAAVGDPGRRASAD
jgi:hypothetical protein